MASKNTSLKSSSSSVPASSSIAADLFGPKPVTSSHIHSSSSSSSSSSSRTIFGSVFGRSSKGGERNSADQIGNIMKQYASMPGSNYSYYQQQTIDQPCNFSNSIYYGGQEVYSPTTRSSEFHVLKKDDKQNDDPNSASRGNWWQGSLYY